VGDLMAEEHRWGLVVGRGSGDGGSWLDLAVARRAARVLRSTDSGGVWTRRKRRTWRSSPGWSRSGRSGRSGGDSVQ
jgi:hypothetical protein